MPEPSMFVFPPRAESRSAPPPTFREARDLLFELADTYNAAKTSFVWPRPERFNWALDWFDAELAAGGNGAKTALKVLGDRVETRTFAELAQESSRLANGLRSIGARRGDRLLMMLGATPELWVTMLASMKLGLVLIPAMPQLGGADIADRLERGAAKFLVAHSQDAEKFARIGANVERIAVGDPPGGWRPFATLMSPNARFLPDGPRRADDPMLLYFTSGTTARSKLVVHSHASYPIGHLSTMYGLGLKPDDVHLNHLLARLGLVERFRPLERGRMRGRARPAVRTSRRARCAGRTRRHLVLRAADRLAYADQAGSRPVDSELARGEFLGRASEPGGDRPGAARPGVSPCAIPTGRPRRR
jgi:AMP-binding enzyme